MKRTIKEAHAILVKKYVTDKYKGKDPLPAIIYHEKLNYIDFYHRTYILSLEDKKEIQNTINKEYQIDFHGPIMKMEEQIIFYLNKD